MPKNNLPVRPRLVAAFPGPANGAFHGFAARASAGNRAAGIRRKPWRCPSQGCAGFPSLPSARETEASRPDANGTRRRARVILRIFARLKTWNPPLSVRIGPGQFMNAMQAAGGLDDLHAGPDVEMVGVAKENLRAHFAQLARVERLDAGLRADRHEDRRLDHAAGGGQAAQGAPWRTGRFRAG